MKLSMPTVLVVDDDANVRSAVDRSLKRNGYRAVLAESAEDAVDVFGSTAVDVVLLDLRLPGMDGHSFLRILHRDDATFPVVIMSGDATMEDAIKAIRLGAFDFLKKPFDDEELVRSLDTALKKRARLGGGTPSTAGSVARTGLAPPAASTPSAGGRDAVGRSSATSSPRVDLAAGVSDFVRESGGAGEPAPGASRPTAGASRPALGGNRPAAGASRPAALTVDDALHQVERQLVAGTLALPVLDDRIGKVQEMMERPSCGVDEVLAVVGKDPTVASLCLRVANSSYYNTGEPIENLRQACIQLGNRRVVALAVEALVRNAFTVRREPFHRILGQLWRNSLITARVTDRLARLVHRSNSAAAAFLPHVDNLYVAALLHNVGELLLLQLFSQVEGYHVREARDLEALADVVRSRHEVLGAKVARRWQLPGLVVRLAGHHHRPAGPFEKEDRKLIRRLVLAAWSVAREGGYDYLPEPDAPDALSLVARLGVDPDRVAPLYAQMGDWIGASEG